MFTPLHQVCTGISGKVQTNIPAVTAIIVLLEVYVQRYVQIRVLICTIYRERRACLQGRATSHLVSVKSALVQTCRVFLRIFDGSANRLHMAVFRGANSGANGCKGANDCPGQLRRREQYFTFDGEVHWAWGGDAAIWLDDSPTMTAMTAVFSRMTATAANEKTHKSGMVLKTDLNLRVSTVQVHICTAE